MLVVVLAVAATIVVLAHSSPAPTTGITRTKVTLGAIVTKTGLAAADFGAYEYGVNAYLYYVNHTLGGVDGRQLVVADDLDDQSNPSTGEADARTLVTSDHVFAIVGVSTAFFEDAASYLKTTDTPVFGYATDNSWAGPQNFFADYGSVIDYATSVPEFAYVADQLHATRVAVFAYDYPSSAAECQPAVTDLHHEFGVTVAYSNLNEPIFNASFNDDVTRMASDHIGLVISCMQASDSASLSQLMHERGLGDVPELWLDGYDRSFLRANAGAMANVYLMLQHVPFEAYAAYPTAFPGLGLYFTEMRDYLQSTYGARYPSFAAYEYDDVALMGWESANLFTEGLRAAGPQPTQAKVIAAINRITNDVGGPSGYGVTSPTNWTIAHTEETSPSCATFVTTSGTTSATTATFTLAFARGHDPWICFPLSGAISPQHPVSPPPGTPGG